MVDKAKDEVRTDARDVTDTMRDNLIRTVDEFAKVQPQYSQSISNLQLDYIQTTKNMIQTAFAAQKQFASIMNVPHALQCVRIAVAQKGATVFAHEFCYGGSHEILWLLTYLLTMPKKEKEAEFTAL